MSGSRGGLAALELVDDIHAAHDFADHRVLAVEERALIEHDEELAVGRMRIAGPRHADGAADIGHVGELGLQVGMVRAAGAVAVFAVAGLRHEAFDDAVKRHVVVKLLARQKLHPLGMAGRDIVAQLDDDAARRGVQHERVLGIDARRQIVFSHDGSSSLIADAGRTLRHDGCGLDVIELRK